MDKQFDFGAIEIPPALHDEVWRSYEALKAKKGHIERLKEGKLDIEQDIKAARAELDIAKKSHVAGFAEIADGATSISGEAKDAKTKIAEVSSRILGLEETLPDFGDAIRQAETEMRPLLSAHEKARREIVKLFRAKIPKHTTRRGDLNGVLEFMMGDGSIDLSMAMMLYLAAHEGLEGTTSGPFPSEGINPARFFSFIGQFFKSPSDEEISVFRNRFDAVIWGDREPPACVPMPSPHTSDDGLREINWDGMIGY